MSNVLLEYIWLDGYKTPNLRSKTKVVKYSDISMSYSDLPELQSLPEWNFDGSSTAQAPGADSECVLIPVRVYKWSQDHYFVICEVYDNAGSPHPTNTRSALRENSNQFMSQVFWWGFEQEYFVTKDHQPLGFPVNGYPPPQGLYYCGVGGNQVVGRTFVEKHLKKCLSMGIELTGINAEVAVGQWEYQCFAKDTLKACDDLWVSRYALYRMAEDHGWDINLSPKPVDGDWNGSGCHTNFSTNWMRSGGGGKARYLSLFQRMEARHQKHISAYGEGNHKRLTGLHETQHIDKFSWGVGDRGASIRVPASVEQNDWKGYIEDRRPASNCDPYVVAKLIVETTTNEDMGFFT